MTLPSATNRFGQPDMREQLTTASPLKLRLARLVTSNAAGHLIGAVTGKRIRHQGIWFDTRGGDFSPRVRAQMFWGGYEGAETRMIRSVLQNSSTVVELGSSLGVTAAHIASVMARGGRLICVEANPRLIPGLRQRATQHANSIRVEVINAAVANHCGSTMLTIAAQTVGSRIGQAFPHETTMRVPALTLREILRRTAVAEFDLVSDIEGAETAFLLQDSNALKQCKHVVIELHSTTVNGNKVSVQDLIRAAEASGFVLTHRHGAVVALSRL